MIGRLALRSLTAHPVRSAVLAAGFGVGVAVMAILLGVAEVVLDQARAPALVGGGDVIVRLGREVPARVLLAGTLQSDALRPRVRVAAPSHTRELYLVRDTGTAIPVSARGGIPSLERALGDEETGRIDAWRDSPADLAWTQATPAQVLRYIDRFHPIPDVPRWADSWAEWLYFNGRSAGTSATAGAPADARFYLTFLVGPRSPRGLRPAAVRLQLERNGRVESYGAAAELTDEQVERAPDLDIGATSVRLEGMQYRIRLDVADARGRRATGTLMLEGAPGRLVPPVEIAGAGGWRTGYVVPVMGGRLTGTITAGGQPVAFDGGSGYHDHNWGFWEGVSWQWGQAHQGDLSVLYGRVFAPADAADADRIPAFVGVLGADGPLGYATSVVITETNDAAGQPQTITVRGRGPAVDITLRFDVESAETTRMAEGPLGSDLDFLQMRGAYRVTGRAGSRDIDFTAPGAAETFRGGP